MKKQPRAPRLVMLRKYNFTPFRNRSGFAAQLKPDIQTEKANAAPPAIKVTSTGIPEKQHFLSQEEARPCLGILPRTGGRAAAPASDSREEKRKACGGRQHLPHLPAVESRTREASARQAHAGATSRRGRHARPAARPLRKASENPGAQEPFASTVRRSAPR